MRRLFTREAREAIRAVVDAMGGDIRFVISSTWREHFNRDEVQTLFEGAGLSFVAERMFDDDRWRTPTLRAQCSRRREINAWMQTHEGRHPFVIIDDLSSGASLASALEDVADPLHGKVVLCQVDIGLSERHVHEIVVALRQGSRPLTGGEQ